MAVKSEIRPVTGFTEITLQLYGSIVLMQGNRDELVIVADEAILPRIRSEVQGTHLVISSRSWTDGLQALNERGILYNITMRKIEGVVISGSANLVCNAVESKDLRLVVSGSAVVEFENMKVDQFSVVISGSCSAQIAGQAERQEIQISGSGNYIASELETVETVLRISGHGNVQINARDKLKVQITGSGRVLYRGSPMLSQQISGSGLIQRIEPQ